MLATNGPGGPGDVLGRAFGPAGAALALELAYRITRRGGMTVSAGLSHPDQKFTLPHLGLVAEERTLTVALEAEGPAGGTP